MAKKKLCELCKKKPLASSRWFGKELCCSCTNIASAIRNNKDIVVQLFTEIHGEQLKPGTVEHAKVDQVQLNFLNETVWKINQEFGGGLQVSELPGRVKDLCEQVESLRQKAESSLEDAESYRQDADTLAKILDVLGDYYGPDDDPVLVVRKLTSRAQKLNEHHAETTQDRYNVPPGYESLMAVLVAALDDAANGKGKDRHATPEPFDQQQMCRIARAVGPAYTIGQATKKAEESLRLGKKGPFELLGAINYLAGAHIVMKEMVSVSNMVLLR